MLTVFTVITRVKAAFFLEGVIGFKVCLALTCLFPIRLLVMYVLYCHTTQHFRTSVGMPFPLTFTNHTHCFMHRRGTASAQMYKWTHSATFFCCCCCLVMHIVAFGNTCIVVWWDRQIQRSHVCTCQSCHPPPPHIYTNTHVTAIAKTPHTKTRRCNTKQYSCTQVLSISTLLLLSG